MPDWMIWMVIAFAIMGCGRGCGRAVHGYGRHHRQRMREMREEMKTVGPRARTQLAEGPAEWQQASQLRQEAKPLTRQPATAPRETPLETLQRQFVAGSLSLEQYEAEVNKLERLD